ncbi:hypothetical protein J6590_003299 [Homalodisca vitripennis]|nr:hypothetical protein J6590_003299 [Homalodisca vitripennis]
MKQPRDWFLIVAMLLQRKFTSLQIVSQEQDSCQRAVVSRRLHAKFQVAHFILEMSCG